MGSSTRTYDVIGGGLANVAVGQYQMGALAGISSLGFGEESVAALAQLFASA